MAEDGIIPNRYHLIQLESSKYLTRTIENVKISDGSLIVHKGTVAGGTLEAINYSHIKNKPLFEINLLEDLKQTQVNFHHWICENYIDLLNVAGPRESDGPIYIKTVSCLKILFQFKM